jgi:hypothetical protein
MRTEEDLRGALHSLEPQNPDVHAALGRVNAVTARRRHRSRVAGAAAGTAVVVVAAVVAVPAVFGSWRGSGRPAAVSAAPQTPRPSRPPAPATRGKVLRFTFTVDPVPGYVIRPAEIAAGRQTAAVESGGPPNGAEVLVYEPGRLDPRAIRGGAPIEVNGHHGYFAAAIDTDTVGGGKRVGQHQPATFWEYAPNAWAVVQGDWSTDTGRVEEMRIARAVRFSPGPLFTVPYRLGYLPSGLQVATGQFLTLPIGGWSSVLIITDTAGRPAAGPSTLTIWVDPVPLDEARAAAGHLTVKTPGPNRRVAFFGTTVIQGDHAYSITIESSGANAARYPAAVQRRILLSLTWAPVVFDMDTWFDTGSAVPAR